MFLTNTLKSDPRHFQILSLYIFLSVGIFLLGWQVFWLKYVIIFSTALLTQYFFILKNKLPFSSLKSAAITAFGLSILFYSNHYYMYALVAFWAITAKFIFTFKGKHFINPANFAIASLLLITNNGWISPGQWGSSIFILLLVSIAGMIVLYSANRLDSGIAFISCYLALEFYRNIIYKGWPLEYFIHQFSNGALLLFSFFMITDPCSTPNHRYGRIIFSVLVAILAFYLSNYHFINGAPIWALFILCPLTPLIDFVLKEKSFSWVLASTKKLNIQF